MKEFDYQKATKFANKAMLQHSRDLDRARYLCYQLLKDEYNAVGRENAVTLDDVMRKVTATTNYDTIQYVEKLQLWIGENTLIYANFWFGEEYYADICLSFDANAGWLDILTKLLMH